MELRVAETNFESNADGTMTVSGYVNKTGQLSNVLGTTKRFVEKITRGAFSKAIQDSQRDIDFLAEHNGKLILASTRNDSLQLREDEQGLYMTATIAPTSWGKDYYELINSGILQNMSFGFRTVKDSWKSLDSGLFERTIEELDLFEVSVVRDPAYSQSTIAARGIDLIEEIEIPIEVEEEKRDMEKMEQMLEQFAEFGKQINALTEEVRSLKAQNEEERAAKMAKDEAANKKDPHGDAVTKDTDPQAKGKQAKDESDNAPDKPEKSTDTKTKGTDAAPKKESPKEHKSADDSNEEEPEEEKQAEPQDKKSENSENDEEDKKKRSMTITQLAELRSRLNSLK